MPSRLAVRLASILSPIRRMCSALRTDEVDAVLGEDFGEARVLRQEAVARMHRVGAGDLAGGEQRRNVEIAVARGRRADADALVGEPHMHGVGVGGRMHRDGRDAELLAGAQHPERDLAAVGDQDFVEHRGGGPAAHSMIISGSPNSTGLAVLDQDLRHRAGARRRDLVHRLHRLDDEQRLAGRRPCCRRRRTACAPGAGAEIGGADHRRGDDAGMLGRIGGAATAAGVAPAAAAAATAPPTMRLTSRPRPTRTRRPSRSISISVRPVSSSSFASSRISSWSISALALGHAVARVLSRRRVLSAWRRALPSCAARPRSRAHSPGCRSRRSRPWPRAIRRNAWRHGFARVDVGDVDLDHRHARPP